MYYLGEESIAVVGHLMRVGMDEIEVARRFAEEVAELRRRAECDALVQLVYDPERRLPNPQRLEAASRCDNLRCVIVW